jgi:predicted nucleic acid-binding protein
MWDTDAPLLADKSAWARVGHHADEWLEALNADRIVSCAVSHLELLCSARTRADGHHRVPPQDAIIAACAAEHGCAVLHYDAHYDRLADVLGFESVWSAPRGTI